MTAPNPMLCAVLAPCTVSLPIPIAPSRLRVPCRSMSKAVMVMSLVSVTRVFPVATVKIPSIGFSVAALT